MQRFWRNESGAVTVDWVVLTAATVGLGIASVGAVRVGVGDLAGTISSTLQAIHVTGNNYLQSSGFDPVGLAWWPGHAQSNFANKHWYGFPREISGWVLDDPTMRVDIYPRERYSWMNAVLPEGAVGMRLSGLPGQNLSIRQSFDAPEGEPLTVSFKAGSAAPAGMRVWFGDTLLQDFDSVPLARMDSYNFNVTAGAPGENVLRFESTHHNGYGGAVIADVEVK